MTLMASDEIAIKVMDRAVTTLDGLVKAARDNDGSSFAAVNFSHEGLETLTQAVPFAAVMIKPTKNGRYVGSSDLPAYELAVGIPSRRVSSHEVNLQTGLVQVRNELVFPAAYDILLTPRSPSLQSSVGNSGMGGRALAQLRHGIDEAKETGLAAPTLVRTASSYSLIIGGPREVTLYKLSPEALQQLDGIFRTARLRTISP